jgi:hypothetical protein
LCELIFKISHRPDGKIADVLASTLRLHNCERFGQLQGVSAAETLKTSHRPDGNIADALARLTLAQLRTLRSTTGGACRRDLENFPSPRWETHIVLVVCRAAVSQSLEAQWPSHRAPSVGTQHLCVLMFKTSHHPMGKWLTCLPRLTLAQLRTLRSTTVGACHRDLGKLPIAPMGKLLTRLPQLTLAQLRLMIWSTTAGTCRRDLQFSHRPDGKIADVLARLTLAQLRTLRSTTVCTCHRDLENFPSPQWEPC